MRPTSVMTNHSGDVPSVPKSAPALMSVLRVSWLSDLIRLAITDVRREIEQMIVAGDRVVAHLSFHGHFTGRFGQIQGEGQAISFIATDSYRIADGRVAENWHIEDNLTLQQQLGLIPK